MASMSIEMRLNLVDTASAPIKAFMSTLQALESAVGSVSGRLDALGTSLGLIKANSAAASAELGTLGAQAGVAAADTARLESTMAGLSVSMERMVAQLAATTAGLVGMGAAATSANAEAGAAMRSVGVGAQGANEHVNTLASSIKGMAQLWAAFKIEKGLKESVADAAEYERTDNRLRNMNLSPADSEAIHQSVRNAGREFHQFDQNEYLEMAIDLRNATGSAKEAAAGLKGFAQSVFAINLSMPSGQKLDQQGQLNFAKLLEGRGVTMDPARMEAEQDLITKIVAATQGRVNPNNLFGNLTYAKGGLGRTMDDDALVTFAAMISQDQVGGGTGGRVGTMMTALVNSVTKARAITTKNRDEWFKLGLVDPDMVNVNKNTNQVTSIQAGAIAGTEIAGKNFKTWVDEYLRPALIKAGVNMDDLTAVKAKTDVLFPNTQAAEGAFQLLSKKALIEKEEANIRGTAGKDEQVANGEKLSAAQWERFSKSMHDLGIAIGTTILPVLNPLIAGFTKLLELFGRFAQDHPILAHLAVLAIAIGGVSLAISGVKNVFGVFGTLAEAFASVARQSTVTAGVVEGSSVATRAAIVSTAGTSELLGGLGGAFARLGGAVTAAAGVVARGFLRMIPWVGALLLAWDLGELIGNLEIGGHKISDWAASLADKVANAFQNMWIRTKQYFGFLTKDAADAQVEANNRANGKKQAALGFGPKAATAPQTGGASGDWGRGEDVSPESKATEDKVKREKAIADQIAANKAGAAGLGGGKGKRGRFANYDADLDSAKNDLRLEEDELSRHMKAEDELYKAGKLSIDTYYDDKLATMRKSTDAQIAELERERAAYQRQGDKAGVNRASTEIELRKRDQADNEKSVQVQREKDLNALKEKGLQLDAQQLEAEGKKNQSVLARKIQQLKKDQEEYLRNGDYEHAVLAQQAIDTAKLTAAWDQYGEAVKKVQEETQTKEVAIDAELKSGNLTKYEAEQKIFKLRQDEARQLDELIAKERALIEASDAPQAVKDQRLKTLGLAQARADSTFSEMNPEDARVKHALDSGIENSFTGLFRNIISGSKSASAAFKDFGNSIANVVDQLVAEQLGRQLFESLFGQGGVSMGGMSGGSPVGIGGFFSSLFGMKSGGSAGVDANADITMVNGASEGGGFFASIGNWLASLPGLAVGTDNVPQDMIAQIHQGEMIVPKYDAERIRAGGFKQSPVVHNHFAIPATVTRETQSQIAYQAGLGVSRASRRNG
ncbi:MAG: hypothetical protein ACXU85_00960 [Xanthobacteraceae bacterium]